MTKMQESTVSRKTAADILYLAACALHETRPDPVRICEMDFVDLYKKSSFHSMTAIVCMGLELGEALTEEYMPGDMVKKWQEAKHKAIRKNMMLDAERQKLFQFMDQKGIWYMPLKGSILKELYPRIGMRQMADQDILFDPAAQRELKQYMDGQGYTVKSVGKGNHDVYEKPPIYNFELHTALFGEMHHPVWKKYYENVKEWLIKDEGNQFGYHFSDEDFYVYLMLHAFKHFQGSGTGLRSLMDCYVYVWKKGDTLDWEYIEREEEKLQIIDFEKESRILAQKLFNDPEGQGGQTAQELRLKEQELLHYIYGSGTYGTVQNRVSKKLQEQQGDGKPVRRITVWKYYWKRLFPDREWFLKFCPFCYHHRWAVPFFCIYRIIRGLTTRRKRLKNEILAVRKTER